MHFPLNLITVHANPRAYRPIWHYHTGRPSVCLKLGRWAGCRLAHVVLYNRTTWLALTDRQQRTAAGGSVDGSAETRERERERERQRQRARARWSEAERSEFSGSVSDETACNDVSMKRASAHATSTVRTSSNSWFGITLQHCETLTDRYE